MFSVKNQKRSVVLCSSFSGRLEKGGFLQIEFKKGQKEGAEVGASAAMPIESLRLDADTEHQTHFGMLAPSLLLVSCGDTGLAENASLLSKIGVWMCTCASEEPATREASALR